MAWESVSLDPIIGTDQNTSTYWNRIYDHFHRNVKTPSSRTLGSLAHRWSTIQECCNRWAGCVEEIDRAPPSGATIQDRVSCLLIFLLGCCDFLWMSESDCILMFSDALMHLVYQVL
jgi:hypothetical protein